MAKATTSRTPAQRYRHTLTASERLDRFLLNYIPTMVFMVAAYYFLFYVSNFHQGMLRNDLNFAFIGLPLEPLGFSTSFVPTKVIFQILMGVYAIALIPFYLKYPWIRSKAYIFLRGLIPLTRGLVPGFLRGPLGVRPRRKGISRDTKQAGLAILLKFFFAPLMINWCWGHLADMFGSVHRTWVMMGTTETFRMLFDSGLFWASFQVILFIDTLLFTIGYILETPRLKNRIVTVEPTFFGWFICLACYPPFNGHTGDFFPWQSNDFPTYASDTIHIMAGCAILVLMGIYSWASVALGFKASNLTNRGIIDHGPYRYVRHPAYITKNLAWWIGAGPTIYAAFSNEGTIAGLTSIMFTACWTLIYGLRAWTEERHLLMTDNGYREYKERVKYRFIPGLY